MNGLFPHSITIYNRYTKNAGNWQGGLPPTSSIAYSRTIIKNTLWEDKTLTTISNEGKPFIEKTVSIIIPTDKMEADKKYVDPKEYPSLAETDVWTLQQGDIIVLGECDKEISSAYTITDLQKEFKTMEIRAVEDTSDKNNLPQWDIEGV